MLESNAGKKARGNKHGCLHVQIWLSFQFIGTDSAALCQSINSSLSNKHYRAEGFTITIQAMVWYIPNPELISFMYVVQEQDEIKKFFLNFVTNSKNDAVTYWAQTLCSESYHSRCSRALCSHPASVSPSSLPSSSQRTTSGTWFSKPPSQEDPPSWTP